MTRKTDIGSRIKEFVMTQFLPDMDPSEIDLDFPVMSNGVVDSVSMLMLINHLEELFDIEFEAHEIDREGFDTFNQMADRVLEKLQDHA